MTEPFLALITPIGAGGGVPTHPIAPGGPPPSVWPSPGYPAHPIAPGGPVPPVDPGYGYPQYPVDPGYGVPGPPYYRPEHPIVLPPVEPGGPPVTIWPKPGPLPHPEHPIVLPPPPTEGLEPGGGKPPPPDGGWGYHPTFGWGYFPGPVEPGPK